MYIGKSPNLGQLYNPDRFSGTGSQTTFTLTNSVTSDQSVIVCISGVKQQVSNYSITGSSLVFDTAPPTGTNNIEVQYLGSSIDVGTVGNSAIDSAKIASDAITTAKIADNQITAPKTDLSIVQGDVIYGSGTDAWARLGAGTSGQFLKTQGAGANPVWADASATTPVNKTGTRNMNTATGTQDITGFGFDPGYVTVRCSFTGSSGQDFMSFGSSDFTTQNCTNYQNGVAVNTFGYHLSAVANMEESSSQSQVATVASITGGIRLSWTKTGSPTSQTMTIFVTAWE